MNKLRALLAATMIAVSAFSIGAVVVTPDAVSAACLPSSSTGYVRLWEDSGGGGYWTTKCDSNNLYNVPHLASGYCNGNPAELVGGADTWDNCASAITVNLGCRDRVELHTGYNYGPAAVWIKRGVGGTVFYDLPDNANDNISSLRIRQNYYASC